MLRFELVVGGFIRKESIRRDFIVYLVIFSLLENSDKNVVYMCM